MSSRRRPPVGRAHLALGTLLVASSVALVAGPATANSVIADIPVHYEATGVAVNEALHRAYVANGEASTVRVVDTDAGSVMATIPFYEAIHNYRVAVDPSTDRVFVAQYNGNTVTYFEGATNLRPEISTIQVQQTPMDMAVDPALHKLFVANLSTDSDPAVGSVSIIDTQSPRLIDTVRVGSYPTGIAVDTVTHRVFVSNSASDTVSVIDADSHALIATLPTGPTPGDIAVDPVLHRAYVSDFGPGITVIDTEHDTVLGHLVTPATPRELAVDDSKHVLYFTSMGTRTLSVMDERTDAVTETLDVGARPEGVAVDVSTHRVYVTELSGNLRVFDGKTAQHLSFATDVPPDRMVGTAYNISATSDGAITVPVTQSIDPASVEVCTLARDWGNGTISVDFIGAGTCVVRADQAGDDSHTAAQTVTQAITVIPKPQQVEFVSNAPIDPVVGDTYDVTAASNGSTATPVTFTIDPASSAGACTVASSDSGQGTVVFTGVGTCLVDADQGGDRTFGAAATVQQQMEVAQGAQQLSLSTTAPTAPVVGSAYEVSGVGGGSTRPVTYSIDPTSREGACTVVDHGDSTGTVHFTGTGACILDADQDGDLNYTAAVTVQQTMTVAPAPVPPRITFHTDRTRLRAGIAAHLTGRATPTVVGAVVLLQKRTGHGWATVARLRERAGGRFSGRLTSRRPATARYRAGISSGGRMTVSPALTIRWR